MAGLPFWFLSRHSCLLSLVIDRRSEYLWWFWPPRGKKQWVLCNSGHLPGLLACWLIVSYLATNITLCIESKNFPWLVQKLFVGDVPDYITDLLTCAVSDPLRSSIWSSINTNLIVTWDEKVFSVAAPPLWNRLDTGLKIMWLLTSENFSYFSSDWELHVTNIDTVMHSGLTVGGTLEIL